MDGTLSAEVGGLHHLSGRFSLGTEAVSVSHTALASETDWLSGAFGGTADGRYTARTYARTRDQLVLLSEGIVSLLRSHAENLSRAAYLYESADGEAGRLARRL